jgi:hypothetical protein
MMIKSVWNTRKKGSTVYFFNSRWLLHRNRRLNPRIQIPEGEEEEVFSLINKVRRIRLN